MGQFNIAPDWRETLRRILDQAKQLGPKAVLAFDLDSTLFDNRPRQARILREFGVARGLAALAACKPEHWTSGWDMRGAMVACGLPEKEADAVYKDAKKFWVERFFTGEYCADDTAVRGAGEFIAHCVATNAVVAYVTGRHEEMRAGTIVAMKTCGFVTPADAKNVRLIMKPSQEVDDDAFKREAHSQLGTIGRVIAAFDNEPTHANDYKKKFPEALVVHLATDHSGRPVELLPGIVSVPDFALAQAT